MSEIASRAVLAEPTGNKAAATLAPAGHLFTQFALGQKSKCSTRNPVNVAEGTFPRNPGVKSAVGECGRAGMGVGAHGKGEDGRELLL